MRGLFSGVPPQAVERSFDTALDTVYITENSSGIDGA